MTKVGKAMNSVAGTAVKASGVATKYGGEAIGEIGKTLGLSKEKCSQVQQSADNLGKDIYYASGTVGKKAEQITDDLVDVSKKAYHSVKETVKDKFQG